MQKVLAKWILAASVMMLGSLNSAYALTSTGADGAFTLNNALTLNASNNQTFNFTTFDLGTGGTLDFSGLTNQHSIFILATGDIHLDGILNLSSSLTFQTTGNIFVTGTVNISSNAFSLTGTNINFQPSAVINGIRGKINLNGGYSGNNNQNPPSNPGAGLCVGGSSLCNENPIITAPIGTVNTDFPISGGNGSGLTVIGELAPIPEPSTYALLLVGISLLMLGRNKLSN